MEKKYEEIINLFVEAGFSEEAAKEQFQKLGDIITLVIARKITDENPGAEQSEEGIQALIREKYSTDEKKKEMAALIAKETQDYLTVVTEKMIPLKKRTLLEGLSKIDLGNLNSDLNT